MWNPVRDTPGRYITQVTLASALLAAGAHVAHAQAVPDPRPTIEVAGSFAFELVADKSWASGVGGRVAIAPWSSRRLSLEFDMSRTLSSAPLNPKTNHGTPTIASAQAGYYFSDARVQPFLGGGIGVIWSSLGHGLAAGERPARGTWNLGGGVRIRVVRAISFRPEFRWYAPNPNAIYRLSFALGYGW